MLGEFQFPVAFNLTATFLFALTGSLAGKRWSYAWIGVLAERAPRGFEEPKCRR